MVCAVALVYPQFVAERQLRVRSGLLLSRVFRFQLRQKLVRGLSADHGARHRGCGKRTPHYIARSLAAPCTTVDTGRGVGG